MINTKTIPTFEEVVQELDRVSGGVQNYNYDWNAMADLARRNQQGRPSSQPSRSGTDQ